MIQFGLSPLNLSWLALGATLLLLCAEAVGARRLIYIAKPAATVLILLLALYSVAPVSVGYQWAIVIGLLFALAGDIFLMMPSDRFLAGLVSFLLTHLCYSIAFWGQTTAPYWSPWGLLIVAYAGLIYALLHRYIGAMRLPVQIYLVAIVAMAWLALVMAWQQAGPWASLAAWGSIFFVLSDSLLALNRFRRPFAAAQWLVLSTYYLAQWLIASSLYV